MKTFAAILVETGRPLVLDELDVPALRSGQVLVRILHSGVCHTQLLECRGHRGPDRWVPHCLGHEGSGVVLEAGPNVTKVAAGDRVILSWMRGSGIEAGGTVYAWNGRGVNAGPITTFSREAVLSENRLTKLPAGVDLRDAALLGCALPTGMGAVVNAAGVRAGQSVAVFGAGGVGLCAIAGAALSGAHPVIAIDLVPAKLALARELGATAAIDAGKENPTEAVAKHVPGGVDVAIEATGRPDVMAAALSVVRARGGSAVVVGNARHGERISLDPWQLNQGKRLLGTWGGDTDPDRDFPRYAALVASGRLSLSALRKSYRLEDVETALADLEAGRVARPILDMADGSA